jgi:hypothetical protein
MESVSVARSGVVAPPVGHPAAGSATLGIELGLGQWGGGSDSQPRTLCPGPPPPIYGAVQRGPTSHLWAGHPRSGRRSRAQLAVGPAGGDQF